MAERRMFAKSIVLSDAFLDMPLSARCLYFTLGMLADDDGFVGSPKAIMRQCGASQDDMNVLLAKRYVLGFESGVIVIKHWRMNNYLRSDRYHDTTYLEEKETLIIDERGAYTEKDKSAFGIPTSEKWLPSGIPTDDKRYTENGDTEVRLDKDSLDKVSLDKDKYIAEPKPAPAEQINHYGEYKKVLLTTKEYEKLVLEFGEIATDRAIAYLDAYIADKGYKTKSKTHNLALRRWVFTAVKEQERRAGGGGKAGTAEQLDAFYNMMSDWAQEGAENEV